jgi:hypothetical protein
MRKFFVDLIKRVGEKEDVFTECVAVALRENPAFARRFAVRLCGDRLGGVAARSSTIDVQTQCTFPARSGIPTCCIDMVLTLDGTMKIGVENKLFAEEGRDEKGHRAQFGKYLAQPLTVLAYIRAQEAAVEESVADDPRYLKPLDRAHFLWSDSYTDIAAGAEMEPSLTTALAALFQHYGFEPPKPEIGDLTHPDPAIAEANRRNFAKLWESTKAELRKLGWRRITPGSIAELYVDEGPSRSVKKVWIDPTWARGLLRVRLTPHSGKQEQLEQALLAAGLPHGDDLEIRRGRARGRVRDVDYVEVTVSFRKLLGDATDTEIMKKLLAEFVTEVFQAAGQRLAVGPSVMGLVNSVNHAAPRRGGRGLRARLVLGCRAGRARDRGSTGLATPPLGDGGSRSPRPPRGDPAGVIPGCARGPRPPRLGVPAFRRVR